MRIAPYLMVGVFELLLLLAVWGVQDGVPLRVVGYLGFCPRHVSVCEDEVSDIDRTMRLTYVADEQYCPPARTDRARDERQILAWLSAHPSMRKLPATIGIRAALLASYHCQISLTRTSAHRLRGRIAN